MSIIAQLAQKMNKGEAEVCQFLFDAPKKYKVYKIPKRTHGYRIIAQPSKELKVYQRAFLDVSELKIHKNAIAYRSGYSIKDNALAHCKCNYLLNMDLEDFFNSINDKLFWSVWKSHYDEISNDDRKWIERLLFWCPSKKTDGKLVLSIGAPTSPSVSNFCLYNFDVLLTDLCADLGVIYTRYADDLTFSSNKKNVLGSVPDSVKDILLRTFGGRLRVNKSKTVFSSKAYNRHVTGITLTNDGSISLGRERKRYIKHLIHKYCLGALDVDGFNHLKGMLSFARHIEPDFILALENKYSSNIICNISGGRYESKK